jgi:hypothetical protein
MANFNDLPAEIRNALYGQLMTEESIAQHRTQNAFAMFTVCKQLHEESSSYFYQHNAIAIDTPSTATSAATILPPVADKYLRFLNRLTLHGLTGQSSMSRTREVATAIASLSCIGAQFSELNILITSSLSQLLNSRVDDSILDDKHPITEAIRTVLQARVAKKFRLQLQNTWFAPGVAHGLQATFGSQIEFYERETRCHDISVLERPLVGRYSSVHLTDLGLGDETIADVSHSNNYSSTPSSLRSSLCSAFSNLDTFSVSSWELGSEEAGAQACGDSFKAGNDASEHPFFTDDDIEEWSASTTAEGEDNDGILGDLEDLDEDEEMEDVSQEVVQAFMHNMEEVAHHEASEDDVEYMVNFAPELLLRRYQLACAS